MKAFIILVLAGITLMACNKITLTEKEAHQLIEQEKKYPQLQSYQIYTKDAEDGRRLLDAGLERDSLVKVERNHKTGENQKTLITFTDKAKEFLLPPDKGQLSSVQKVKIADEVIDSIVSIQIDEKQQIARITYTSKYVNVNPFSKLEKRDFGQTKKHQIKLVYSKEGWDLQ